VLCGRGAHASVNDCARCSNTRSSMSAFRAVLADPPLRFDTRSPKGEGRSALRHYATHLASATMVEQRQR
jgi:hypothetical protein